MTNLMSTIVNTLKPSRGQKSTDPKWIRDRHALVYLLGTTVLGRIELNGKHFECIVDSVEQQYRRGYDDLLGAQAYVEMKSDEIREEGHLCQRAS